jgi:hypothetical protein
MCVTCSCTFSRPHFQPCRLSAVDLQDSATDTILLRLSWASDQPKDQPSPELYVNPCPGFTLIFPHPTGYSLFNGPIVVALSSGRPCTSHNPTLKLPTPGHPEKLSTHPRLHFLCNSTINTTYTSGPTTSWAFHAISVMASPHPTLPPEEHHNYLNFSLH